MSTLVEECKRVAGPVWDYYENHPWFEALENGTLPRERFVRFQLEDAPFIPHLHQAIACALGKAPTGSPWSRAATKLLSEVFVSQEMDAKRHILEELGVSDFRFDRWALSPRREAYANHLLRAALEGTTGQAAAALLPCAFFTEVVGRRFESVDIKGPEAYQRWATIYASKQVYNMLEAHIGMMEYEAGNHPGCRPELIRLFVRSAQHQVAVFDDALNPGPGFHPVACEDLQPLVPEQGTGSVIPDVSDGP